MQCLKFIYQWADSLLHMLPLKIELLNFDNGDVNPARVKQLVHKFWLSMQSTLIL